MRCGGRQAQSVATMTALLRMGPRSWTFVNLTLCVLSRGCGRRLGPSRASQHTFFPGGRKAGCSAVLPAASERARKLMAVVLMNELS
jgi:hypothetical protein